MKNITLRSALSESLSISLSQINRLILRAPHTYKIYTIPKKTGGERTIAQPARETKYIQAWLINKIFTALPVHECASAYKQGASIKNNALTHIKGKYLVKFDFKDFFHSIKEDDLKAHIKKHLGETYDSNEIADIARLSCIQFTSGRALCLSVGAPSSPLLSNSIMYEFDKNVHAWCKENKIQYTRYADDLTFSTNIRDISGKIEPAIRGINRGLEYPKLRFNNSKTVFLSKKFQRRITGLIITNNSTLSIGRDRKREISVLIHKFSLGTLDASQHNKLQGLLGFAKDIEPDFINRMYKKYGFEKVNEIIQMRKPINTQ